MRQGDRCGPYVRRLRADPEFFLDLHLCHEWGIPHSYFLGAKKLRWSAVDRAKARAFYREKNAHCTMCGTAGWEWDPRQGGERRAYEAVESYCPGCHALEHARELLHEDKDRNTKGITHGLMPTRGRDADERLMRAERRWLAAQSESGDEQ